MALRDKLKKKQNCFRTFSMPDWVIEGETMTLRALTVEEEESLFATQSEDAADVPKTKSQKETVALKAFSLYLGDSIGERVYLDSDLAEIRNTIPGKVILEVCRQGQEYNSEQTKKN